MVKKIRQLPHIHKIKSQYINPYYVLFQINLPINGLCLMYYLLDYRSNLAQPPQTWQEIKLKIIFLPSFS